MIFSIKISCFKVKEGREVTYEFADECINNPINNAEKLIKAIKDHGVEVLFPKLEGNQ